MQLVPTMDAERDWLAILFKPLVNWIGREFALNQEFRSVVVTLIQKDV